MARSRQLPTARPCNVNPAPVYPRAQHAREDEDDFARQLRLAQLQYVCSSTAAATSLAENYVGLERV